MLYADRVDGFFFFGAVSKRLTGFCFCNFICKNQTEFNFSGLLSSAFLRIYFENILWIDFLGAASLYRGEIIAWAPIWAPTLIHFLGAHLNSSNLSIRWELSRDLGIEFYVY